MSETLSELADQQCLVATTWRRDGTPVMTTIWPVPWGDGEVAFLSQRQAGKTKRLRLNGRLQLQASDWDGFPLTDSEPVACAGRIVDGDEFEQVTRAVMEKYGQDAWDASQERGEAYLLSRGESDLSNIAVIASKS